MSYGQFQGGPLKRLQARSTVKPVNFICLAPQAGGVTLVGDFNHWQPGAHPMNRHVDGSWQLSVPLGHGHHRYAFLVDGELTLDPRAQGVSRDYQGRRVSLMSVS